MWECYKCGWGNPRTHTPELCDARREAKKHGERADHYEKFLQAIAALPYIGTDKHPVTLEQAAGIAERALGIHERSDDDAPAPTITLTHDDCNVLMFGLGSLDELDFYPDAIEHYERLQSRIIDLGCYPDGGPEWEAGDDA